MRRWRYHRRQPETTTQRSAQNRRRVEGSTSCQISSSLALTSWCYIAGNGYSRPESSWRKELYFNSRSAQVGGIVRVQYLVHSFPSIYTATGSVIRREKHWIAQSTYYVVEAFEWPPGMFQAHIHTQTDRWVWKPAWYVHHVVTNVR